MSKNALTKRGADWLLRLFPLPRVAEPAWCACGRRHHHRRRHSPFYSQGTQLRLIEQHGFTAGLPAWSAAGGSPQLRKVPARGAHGATEVWSFDATRCHMTHCLPPSVLTYDCRLAATQNVSGSEAHAILAKQRVQRPVSPHLTIYKPQITWIASSFNRITGVALSGGLYLFGFAYLAAPTFGWHLETPSLVAAVASWPVAVKVIAKATVAFPFFFHSLNGFRHLAWDMGIGFTNKAVMQTGWTVVGLTVATSLYYTLLG